MRSLTRRGLGVNPNLHENCLVMMEFHSLFRWRDAVSVVVCLGCVALCATAARDLALRPTQFAVELNHAQLLQWLCERDVHGQFTSAKLRLARRVAEDLRQGYDWQRDLAELDEQLRRRCLENLRELARIWILERADRYASLSEPDRTAFVDEQLDDVLYWPVWRRHADARLAAFMPRTPTLAVQQIDSWTGALDAHQRQRIQQFAGALYFRWLQRGYQFLPGGA